MAGEWRASLELITATVHASLYATALFGPLLSQLVKFQYWLTVLNPTRQYDSKSMLSFRNRVPDIKLLKFHENRDNRLTSKNMIFNESSFVKSETTIGFVAFERVRE